MSNPSNGQRPNGAIMLPTADNGKIVPTVMEPIQVTVIGSGTGTGDGSSQQLIETPKGQRNVVATFVTPLVAIVIRFLYTFGTTLIGLLSAGMATNIIPATTFFDLVWKCATLSVAGAAFGAIKDFVVIVGRLKDKYPLSDV